MPGTHLGRRSWLPVGVKVMRSSASSQWLGSVASLVDSSVNVTAAEIQVVCLRCVYV